jgi:signal peptidase I
MTATLCFVGTSWLHSTRKRSGCDCPWARCKFSSYSVRLKYRKSSRGLWLLVSCQRPPSSADEEPQPQPSSWIQRLKKDPRWDDIFSLTLALAVAWIVRWFVVEPRFIPSLSMYPTFLVGDQLLVEKVSKYVRPIQRGDVVVFHPTDQLVSYGYRKDEALIKRVVAVEGDFVYIRDGKVFVNGTPVVEKYIAEQPDYIWGPVQIPQGYLLVLGDNRNNSFDSHIWGLLPKEKVIGRAIFKYWPIHRVGWIEH